MIPSSELVETVQSDFNFGTGRSYKSLVYNGNESEIMSSGIGKYLDFDMVTDTYTRHIPTNRFTALRKQDPRNIQYTRRTKGYCRHHRIISYLKSIILRVY